VFKSFPNINYNINGITYDIVNIFKKLNYTVPENKILTTTVNYGERPDQISQRLYETPDYYWAVILANKDNPFIDPIERLGETAKTTAELEAGEDLDPRDFFVQFSRSAYDVYVDDWETLIDLDPTVTFPDGVTLNTQFTDHRTVDFYKFTRPGDILVFEPQNENIISFGPGQQKLQDVTPLFGQSIVPEQLIRDNTPILAVETGKDNDTQISWSAALDTTGLIHFWGGITGSPNLLQVSDNYFKSSTAGYTFMHGSGGKLLAIRASDGGVTCFGDCSGFNTVYSGQKNFKKIVWSSLSGSTAGLGISGNAYYSNLSLISSPVTRAVSYTINGKDELYIFGGLTTGFGYTHEVEYKLSGHTWPVDIACARHPAFSGKSICYCMYSKMPKPSNPNASVETQALYGDFVGWANEGETPTKTLIQYREPGVSEYQGSIPTTTNSFIFKTQYEIWERMLQHLKNENALQYNGSTGRYYLDFSGGATFDTLTYTTTADLLNHLAGNNTRNSDHWLQSLGTVDVSCISVWQSRSVGSASTWAKGGCLITPQHVISHIDVPFSAGDIIRWVSMDNTTVSRTIIDVLQGSNNTIIGLLDSAVPTTGAGSIKIPKVWNKELIPANTMNGNFGADMWSYGVRSDKYRRLTPQLFNGKGFGLYGFQTYGGTKQSCDIFNSNFIGSCALGSRPYETGDVGSPVFYLCDGELVYLGFITGQIFTATVYNSVTLLQSWCNTLSSRNSKTNQTVQSYQSGVFVGNESVINPLMYKEIRSTDQGPLIASRPYGKNQRYLYNHSDSFWIKANVYANSFTPNTVYTVLQGVNDTYQNPVIAAGKWPVNYGNSVIVHSVNTSEFGLEENAQLEYYSNDFLQSIQILGPTGIEGNSIDITPPIPQANPTPLRTDINDVNDILVNTNLTTHSIIANANKTSTSDPYYLQVISVDNPWKRIFVKDLNGTMTSFINADPAGSRISIIRKNDSGYYQIIKILNNSIKGIVTSKALRSISRVIDLSNANPSNKTQWSSYLNVLTAYVNDTLTEIDAGQIARYPDKNPIQINYYSKDFVRSLESDLPTLLK
jgi:hypothetical protein